MGEKLIEAGPVTTDNAAANNDLAIVVAIPPATNVEDGPINGDKKNKKKRSGSFNLLKAAMVIFRNKPVEKLKPPAIKVDVASKGDWKKIVGSMRPLHLQDNQSPSASPLQSLAATDDDDHQLAAEQFEDVLIAPPSPSLSSTSYSTGTMSQYASANNLQDLDSENEDDEDEDHVFDDKPADAMIDAKAEEFIAYFYAQMRRQQLDSAHHHRIGYQ